MLLVTYIHTHRCTYPLYIKNLFHIYNDNFYLYTILRLSSYPGVRVHNIQIHKPSSETNTVIKDIIIGVDDDAVAE